MKCKQCGKRNNREAIFCERCGADLQSPDFTKFGGENIPGNQYLDNYGIPQRKRTPWIWALFGLVGMVGLCIVIVLAFQRKPATTRGPITSDTPVVLSSPTIAPMLIPTSTTDIPLGNVPTDDDPSIGPENAPVTIIEFSDYQCGYCQAWYQQTFNQLMSSYPDKIRFVYRDLPLPMHGEALPAAEAADCAGEQGAYWKFHDSLFSGQYDLGRTAYEQYATDLELDMAAFTTCLDDHRYQAEVLGDADDAANLGLNGTPSFVINGRFLIGAYPLNEFKRIIDEELAKTP
jgi:protein-disulfide isomerase